MLWLITASFILTGFHFDEQIASLGVFSTAETQVLVMGALFGLGVGLLIRKFETI
jgi:hypothetical protein